MDQAPGPRVVTIGGGHGQASLLLALTKLDCDITAIVSVADDGGCSGHLRRDLNMPPPGDLRRCLTALARRRELAERFERRLMGPDGRGGRCAGNLVIGAAYRQLGSLQAAVDWAGDMLECKGRVVPAAESAGVLMACGADGALVEGETEVAHRASPPYAAMVHGPTQLNPVALEAILAADLILIGPGSFFTSTLAALMTADIASAVVQSAGRRVLMLNLLPEGEQTEHLTDDDYLRMVRDHVRIATLGGEMELAVLRHRPGQDLLGELADGTAVVNAMLASEGMRLHDPQLVAAALVRHFGLEYRACDSVRSGGMVEAEACFERYLSGFLQEMRGHEAA